ncbi:MAG: endoglucanase [Roseburia sp.]|nr:endoglucanase [Roseburia sp.]MCM1243083.1 endoglucanase [Roseburia sp.]
MRVENYEYRNLPIPGGGYVTGFIYHEKKPGVFYIRTDIGGSYRFDMEKERWISLIDHVTMEDISETFPIALALDDAHPQRLYIACGINKEASGVLAVSEDYGEHFIYHKIPVLVHGNLNGRGTGYRLLVDKKDSDRLFFASQQEGLWMSPDRGIHWEKKEAFPDTHMTFAGQSKDGAVLFAACAGVATKRGEHLRGHSLYVSYDDGAHFKPLWQPQDSEIEGVRLAGLVAQRYAVDDSYLYVTFSVMGRNAYVLENGYSCDGGSVIGGRVVRYPWLVTEDGTRLGAGEELFPQTAAQKAGTDLAGQPGGIAAQKSVELEYGFGGIAAAASRPGLLICSTICKDDGDCIFRSFDHGEHWEVILYDLEVGRMAFRTSYMKPCYNGGHSLIHWLTDLKINPFEENEAWFNTGTGVFRTKNLTETEVVFSDHCDGLEETVHLNLYSPPKGDVQLIDILGDLGGFAFSDLDKPCDNSFADAEGNRYITCINADYSDKNPDFVAVTPRGNWTGKTRGGLIVSKDQCRTFTRLPMPFGITEKLDVALHNMETPNVNSGWVAVSPDCQNLVWSVAEGISLPVDMVIASQDGGASFTQAKVYDLSGEIVNSGGMKVFSDRVESSIFYGFGERSQFYVSRDGGRTFRQKTLRVSGVQMGIQNGIQNGAGDNCPDFPQVEFSLIDCANKTEVRGESGRQGVFYMALGTHGLWKLYYDMIKDDTSVTKLSKKDDVFYRLGLGVLCPNGDYYHEAKAIYTSAVIDGEYGFYRSTDDGASFTRLNTEKQMYGEINSIEGDSRVYGRFYLATGSRGVLYGQPCEA